MDGARSGELKTPPFDLVKHRWLWFGLSGTVFVVGMVSLIFQGLVLGTDFTGGAEIQYRSERPLPDSEAARATMADHISTSVLGLGSGAVKTVTVGNDADGRPIRELLIRIPARSTEEIASWKTQITDKVGAAYSEQLGSIIESKDANFIGPVIGRELKRQAIWCLIVGLGLILVYIRQRYNIRMATAGVAALFHDVGIMTGMMSLGRWEVNAPFVAAILTVVGYSINDTVVIYDRIRENLQSRASRSESYHAVVNFSLWQTMSRSINTVLTVLIVLFCLLLFGGATLREFVIALLIGIFCGMYSSIFNASQIIVQWDEWSQRRRARGKVAKDAKKALVGPSAGRRRIEELARARARAAEAAGATAAVGGGIESAEATDSVPGGDGLLPEKSRAQAAKAARTGRQGKSRRRH